MSEEVIVKFSKKQLNIIRAVIRSGSYENSDIVKTYLPESLHEEYDFAKEDITTHDLVVLHSLYDTSSVNISSSFTKKLSNITKKHTEVVEDYIKLIFKKKAERGFNIGSDIRKKIAEVAYRAGANVDVAHLYYSRTYARNGRSGLEWLE